MASKKKTVTRKVGYFAYVLLDYIENDSNGFKSKKANKVSKWQKVGTLSSSKKEAYDAARKRYGSNAKIRVEGVRVDVRPFYLKTTKEGLMVVYEEYRPVVGQPSYSCGSSREGKL